MVLYVTYVLFREKNRFATLQAFRTLKMEAQGYIETTVHSYQRTRRHTTEKSLLQEIFMDINNIFSIHPCSCS
jgi:hypothetical protein